MANYQNKQELIDTVLKYSGLFIREFDGFDDLKKHDYVVGVDKTPFQMIAYQIGIMELIIDFEITELQGGVVDNIFKDCKFHENIKLHEKFYENCKDLSLRELCHLFLNRVQQTVCIINGYSEDELFNPNKRQWVMLIKPDWSISKLINVNTIALFKTFRAMIKKYKKLMD
ncbi:MAG: hypothetical protein BWY78_00826 [Alphaproteobacteria bacterium ADurb.Bin438]|nr:MAG: hypothetical protein BWY78_00826 [Alphaproteobacteria bacterium ADurb.Bin438]